MPGGEARLNAPVPSRRAWVLGTGALVAIVGLAWVVATQGPLAPVKVTVAAARGATLERAIFGIGTVEARRNYNVGPTVAGRVARVLVDHGDHVVAGQLLAEMDPIDADDRVAAAGAVAERAGHNVRAAEAAVIEAVSRARVVEASADRFAELQRRNFVGAEAADAKRHEANAAQAARLAAEAALGAARDEARRAAADRDGSGKARRHLRLVSPVAGVVAARLAEAGSTVVAGQAIVQVIDPASLWVRTRIDQGRAGGLAVGLPADIVLRSHPATVLRGTVDRVELLGDAVAEERIAGIAFGEAMSVPNVGELAEVTVRLPTLAAEVAIPAAAVKRVGKVEGVWRNEAGKTLFVPLTVGAGSRDGLVEVRSGLRAGDSVIVHASRPLVDGLRVTVVDSLIGARSAP